MKGLVFDCKRGLVLIKKVLPATMIKNSSSENLNKMRLDREKGA